MAQTLPKIVDLQGILDMSSSSVTGSVYSSFVATLNTLRMDIAVEGVAEINVSLLALCAHLALNSVSVCLSYYFERSFTFIICTLVMKDWISV